MFATKTIKCQPLSANRKHDRLTLKCITTTLISGDSCIAKIPQSISRHTQPQNLFTVNVVGDHNIGNHRKYSGQGMWSTL